MNSNKTFRLPFILLLLAGILMGTALSAKTVKEELDAAKKAKKAVFLVVTGNGVQAATATKLATEAQKKTKDAVVVTLNRDDAANKELVTTFAVGSAPLPLIMVIGSNGLAAGGLQEKDATADKLIQMVPSPKKAEALGYINDKKPVFIIGYKKSFADRAKVMEDCKTAITSLKGNASYVEVDLDDVKEQAFMKQIGTDMKATKTQIIVFNSQGKNTGNFTGITEPTKLVSAAQATPKSGCAPGACSPGKVCK